MDTLVLSYPTLFQGGMSLAMGLALGHFLARTARPLLFLLGGAILAVLVAITVGASWVPSVNISAGTVSAAAALAALAPNLLLFMVGLVGAIILRR